MKDITGRALRVGQTVVTMFDDYSTLTICKVEKIANKKVGVSILDNTTAPITTEYRSRIMPVRYKFPDQVAIVNYGESIK